MKVLLINQSDKTGGAAIAAVRLLDALTGTGMEAGMLVLDGETDHPGVHSLVQSASGRLWRKIKFVVEVLTFIPYEKNRAQRFAFSSGRFGYDISRHPLVQAADIIHLRWVNQGLLSLRGLEKLIKTGKPIVWTLHDTWPFTGGCHYPGSCGGFTSTCGHCPLLKSPGQSDLSSRQHKRKERLFENASISFVGCSSWMKEMAEKSTLVRKDLKHKVRQVFNPVDVDLFCPSDKAVVRRELNLPSDKKLVLFGAANVNDSRKGISLLLRALKNLYSNRPKYREELELVVFGRNASALQSVTPFRLHSFDMVSSQRNMARLYQACDIFVLPSMQDNLPNTVVESLACGTPVVAFEVGGVPEIVRHNYSGYLASPGIWRELGEGILTLLNNPGDMQNNARQFALQNFAPDLIAKQYQKIYQSLY